MSTETAWAVWAFGSLLLSMLTLALAVDKNQVGMAFALVTFGVWAAPVLIRAWLRVLAT